MKKNSLTSIFRLNGLRRIELKIAALFLILPIAVNADLVDRGDGLIYDDELDITWVQIADLAAGSSFDDGGGTFGDPSIDGLLTWDSAAAFVDSLDYGGFDDWRLPTMDSNNDLIVVNCAFVSQADCLDNELGYLYFYGLGGTGSSRTGDTDPFTGILFRYWGSDEVAPSSAWTFDFVGGIQGPVDKNGDAFANPAGAWAVRAGDVTSICPPQPLAGCVRPILSGMGKLTLKNNGGSKDRLKFLLKKLEATSLADFGDPTIDTKYSWCLYEQDLLIQEARTQPGANWSARGKGFKYKDKSMSPDGLMKVTLNAGESGKAKLTLGGKGPKLHNPTTPLNEPVTGQLINSEGMCWDAEFSGAKKNDAGQYNAKGE